MCESGGQRCEWGRGGRGPARNWTLPACDPEARPRGRPRAAQLRRNSGRGARVHMHARRFAGDPPGHNGNLTAGDDGGLRGQ